MGHTLVIKKFVIIVLVNIFFEVFFLFLGGYFLLMLFGMGIVNLLVIEFFCKKDLQLCVRRLKYTIIGFLHAPACRGRSIREYTAGHTILKRGGSRNEECEQMDLFDADPGSVSEPREHHGYRRRRYLHL